jgi:hypothetical protein
MLGPGGGQNVGEAAGAGGQLALATSMSAQGAGNADGNRHGTPPRARLKVRNIIGTVGVPGYTTNLHRLVQIGRGTMDQDGED